MTRRSFITDMLKCGIATTFLPGAGRIWKPTYSPARFVVHEPTQGLPFWAEETRLVSCYSPEYTKYMEFILSGNKRHLIGKFGDHEDIKIRAEGTEVGQKIKDSSLRETKDVAVVQSQSGNW